MAAKKITAQVLGGETKTFEAIGTVKDVYNQLGLTGEHTAAINGEPADMDSELNDYEFVTFSKSVKGGIV